MLSLGLLKLNFLIQLKTLGVCVELCLIVNLPEDKGIGIFLYLLSFVIGWQQFLKEKKRIFFFFLVLFDLL